MYQKIKAKFKANPTIFYACSIVASWQILIPLGVMGIWQLMSTIRIYVVVAAVLFSIILDLVSDRKEAAR